MTLFDTSVVIDARDSNSPWHRWAQERVVEAVAGDGAGFEGKRIDVPGDAIGPSLEFLRYHREHCFEG